MHTQPQADVQAYTYTPTCNKGGMVKPVQTHVRNARACNDTVKRTKYYAYSFCTFQ